MQITLKIAFDKQAQQSDTGQVSDGLNEGIKNERMKNY